MSLLYDSYISYLNLDKRTDRREHMERELARVGIQAERTRGRLPNEFDLTDPKLQPQVRRTPGSIGCWHGMVEIAEEALELRKHAMIFEDDVKLSQSFNERLPYVENFLDNNKWDIFWWGALFHCNPPHWHNGQNEFLLESNLGYDAELTDDPHIIRTFGCFSTHCWTIHKDSIQKVIDLLDSVEHRSIGIDHACIVLQPQLLTYTHVPGLAIQIDNQSNIGNGWTIYSSFARLNGNEENSAYWFQDDWRNFDPLTFNWAEIKKH